ncbi:hypothetical protein FS749_000154 [Ceratobasidium sp. UAMH 11750]|nr:hypothetical protein FS749_000154 [Ceratobasidium sp. UAMH 11750]
MLAQRGRLVSLVKLLRARQMIGSSVASTLEERTTRAIHDAMHAEDHRKEIRLLLGWSYSKVCLPLCGGVSRDNVMFLLELLWEDRKSFLTVGSSHLSPRYSPILFVLWQSLIHMESGSIPEAAWSQLHDLVYRYYLFTQPSEALFLQKIAFHAEDQVTRSQTDWPDNTLDPDDSRNIINAYIRRLTLDSSHSDLLGIKFATCFYDFAFRNFTRSLQDLIPELLRTSMIRLWAEFEDTGTMRGRMPWIVRYAARTFQWAELLRDEITVEEHKLAFAKVLFEQDFVNLAARSLLMTSTQETGFPPSDSVLEDIADDWDYLAQSITLFCLKEEGTLLVRTGLFHSMIPELVKALVYQHHLTFSLERGSRPRKHAALIMSALANVGKAIGWDRHELELYCCSPRCAYPGVNGGVQFLCPRCQKATYCSERCQKMYVPQPCCNA